MTRLRGFSILLVVAGSLGSGRDGVVFPSGTTLAVRFAQSIKSGRDSVGTVVWVQTLSSLVADDCVVVPAYTQVVGWVTLSRAGHIFGGRGRLAVRFDSIQVDPGHWAAIEGVLDTLEYTPGKDVSRSGVVYGSRTSVATRAVSLGLMGATEIDAVPLAVLGGYWLVRRGPAARIVAGEVGRLRLTAPLRLAVGPSCVQSTARRAPPPLPALPTFLPRSDVKNGRVPADPTNFLFLGGAVDLDSAFRRAGWVGPTRGSVATVTREIVAGIANRQAIGAPLSTQYFHGRRQDLAYQLSGPTARSRHHIRIWLLDSAASIWVGAANQDVGVTFNPLKGRFTHRIHPAVDAERERIVQELTATGCADLLDYVDVPGAVKEGRNATGQRFVTDGRTAVVLIRSCNASSPSPPPAENLGERP